MIVDRIKYTQEFNILGEKIWAGMEASLQEGEDPIAASKEMAAMVNASHQSILFSDTVGNKEQIIQKEEPKTQIQKLIEAIKGSSDLKVLDSFKLLIKGKPEAEAAYSETEKKLINDATK